MQKPVSIPFPPVLWLCALALAVLAGCSETPRDRGQEYAERAEALFEAGDMTKAGIEARNALQIDPRNADARFVLARTDEAEGKICARCGQPIPNENLALDSGSGRPVHRACPERAEEES